MIPAVVVFSTPAQADTVPGDPKLVMGLKGFNIIVGLMAAGAWNSLAGFTCHVFAAQAAQVVAADPDASLAAAISTGLATVGAGIAVSGTGAAAVGAIAEKPESFGRSLIFVGLAEGIAIYGLIISFLVLNR